MRGWLLAGLLILGCVGAAPRAPEPFWVYRDGPDGMPFSPHGWMPGEAGQMLKIELASRERPQAGEACLAFEVTWRPPDWFGVGFFSGPAEPPWWGDDDRGHGVDLSAYDTLSFWARGERGGEQLRVEIGTLAGKPHGDSLPAAVGTPWLTLSADWQRFELDLSAYRPEQRARVCGGFTVLCARDRQPAGTARTRFWIDTVAYENQGRDAPAESPRQVAGMGRWRELMAAGRFVAYTPTSQDPTTGAPATPAGIRADLARLRPYFDVIITYSFDPRSGTAAVVPLAAELGLRVVPGVWNVTSPEEQAAVIDAVRRHPETVPAMLVGNETQLFGRATPEQLAAALDQLRAALPELPLSTSEPPGHLTDPALLRRLDFLAPNLHWVFAGGERTDVAAGCAWTARQLERLRDLPGGAKPILLKESGLPSGPAPYSPELQAAWWRAWLAAHPNGPELATVVFEAYDAPWKPRTNPSDQAAIEAHWGVFSHAGEPKAALAALARR